MNMKKLIWMKLRIVMGLIMLWAFADKLIGLGYATKSSAAWINGGSPTAGYLKFATKGPFAEYFQSLAGFTVSGVHIIDWLFMLSLLAVGIALVINKYLTLAAVVGGVLFFLMYLSAWPPENNPLLDEHIVYILVLAVLAIKSKER